MHPQNPHNEKVSSPSSSTTPILKSNPSNYQKRPTTDSWFSPLFKLSTFNSYYSFFSSLTASTFSSSIPKGALLTTMASGSSSRVNMVTRFIHKIPEPFRTVALAGIASIVFIAYHDLPHSSADDTIGYWTGFHGVNLTNVFKSRLYHKKETAFLTKIDSPYPFESEFDLLNENAFNFSKEWHDYWREMKLDANPPNTQEEDLIHPLDSHIFTLRKGKQIDLEHLWFLYLQLHSIKYDTISELIRNNKVSNDLLYDLKIASTRDDEFRHFTQNYVVNKDDLNNKDSTKSLDELIQQNISHQNLCSIFQKRKLNEEYQRRLITKKDLLTPQDYLRIFYTENRTYRFSAMYDRNFVK
ncbi:hypothetical protein FDP41_009016 [Naegleria fowleri]|uniref:Uncharacterized protein n=1 Tax=Naegleria fowleri TaxID=5763 RepID=A0A6A5B426_NAEFO|nr:uncharacterized protein FDP41_009016 [Naegleria fowleri]KAF0972767.1 hypothetical protein FDP41_009016 [Naegleria fowleri]CAG4716429.1 unnamed protein product [Naegleria fowleri]